MLGRSIGKNSLLLACFALVTAGLLAGTYQLTRDQIELAERAAAQAALFEIIPQEQHTNDLLEDTLVIPQEGWAQLGLNFGGLIHRARQNDQVTAVIIPSVAPDGYSGAIRMLVGVNREGTVSGVRVLNHRETPGLGDKVDLSRSDWILSFDGRALGDPPAERWAVRRDGGDFDQFTGATITPRAVINQVRRTLEYVEENRELLFPESAENGNVSTRETTPSN
ncbi:electron transport complex subunit RsxG [Marinimicrobium sp. ABcell2]|uniref:electron transport complex subunit RsxG n=1 Tax=Marinimicrobium sp. ABcell2 TaxID=3069751 RepID=UPI0027B68CFA|nr:electron transport complex subunit RsxG [Marinimicrobium sp. ABcell2]MDQ2078466.1 electron transport complex subunit RsxG [Marinimicrobium sp. ABcell2]